MNKSTRMRERKKEEEEEEEEEGCFLVVAYVTNTHVQIHLSHHPEENECQALQENYALKDAHGCTDKDARREASSRTNTPPVAQRTHRHPHNEDKDEKKHLSNNSVGPRNAPTHARMRDLDEAAGKNPFSADLLLYSSAHVFTRGAAQCTPNAKERTRQLSPAR